MRRTIAIYYIVAGLLLLIVSLVYPPTVAEASMLGRIDTFASWLLPDTSTASRGSGHPAVIRITYLIVIAASAIGAVSLATLTLRGRPSPRFENRSPIRVSPYFMLIAGVVVAAVPFLPLLPTGVMHPFRAIDLAIQQSRGFLAFWNILFLVGYSAILFSVILGIASLVRGKTK